MNRVFGTIAAIFLTAALGQATTTFTYNLFPSSKAGDANLGNTHTFSSSLIGIVTTGYLSNGIGGYNLSNLYIKNDGGDEKGIGLNADPSGDHEIISTGFVQFNLANVWALPPTSFTMLFGSTTGGEKWNVYGSNTAGSLGSLLQSGTSESTVTFSMIPTAYQYLDVIASGPSGTNVTVVQIVATADGGGGGGGSVQSVPEPTTYALFSGGLILLALLGRASRIVRTLERGLSARAEL